MRSFIIVSLAVLCFVVGVVTGLFSYDYFFSPDIDEEVEPDVGVKIRPTEEMVEKVVLYDEGEEQVFDPGTLKGRRLISSLTRKLHQVDMQSGLLREEQVEEVRENGRVVELVFREPADVGISIYVDPEERYHVAVDAEGYAILEDVGNAIFVLEGSEEGSRGYIYIGYNLEEGKRYGCWGISAAEYSVERDKTWVVDVEEELRGEIGPPPTTSPPSQMLTIKTDKTSYHLGEEVRISLCLRNTRSEPLTVKPFPPEISVLKFYYEPVRVFTPPSKELVIEPEEEICYSLKWDQLNDTGEQVSPEPYFIRTDKINVESTEIKSHVSAETDIISLEEANQ